MTAPSDAAGRDPSASGETPLTGGNTTAGVVRAGRTVRRPRSDRSAFSARVLLELKRLGFPFAPRHLGVDELGRDVLSHIDGTTTEHPLQRDERSYAAMASILRTLHESTAGIPLAAGGACLVHGDPGPFNVICRDGYDRELPGEVLLGAMRAAQDRILDAEGRNAEDERLGDARRAHARRAVAWATGDRRLLDRNAGVVDAALRPQA